MDFEFRYKVTYADGTIIKSRGYGLLPISKESYKLIVSSAISGIPLAEIKGIPSVLSRMKEHALYMAGSQVSALRLKRQPVVKVEFFLPEGDLERFKRYPDPFAVIDRPASSMELYRSDGSCMTISCDNGLVRVNDYGKRNAFLLYDTDEFANQITEDCEGISNPDWSSVNITGEETDNKHVEFEDDWVRRTLREKRIALRLTQKQVADRAQITVAQYQKFESGERNIMNASFRLACYVIEALEMNIADFYHGKICLPHDDSIRVNTLADIDAAIVNLKKGNVSDPIDLSDF